jgi:hypothetical protein
MNQAQRIMWNGTVRALPLQEQLRAAAIAGCQSLSVTPSDYTRWLGTSISTNDMLAMTKDAGVRITHLDPFVRWVDQWMPDLPGEKFPTDSIAFDSDDFFRMAAALRVESFTAWGGFPAGRYQTPQLIDAFGALCQRAGHEGLRCDLEFIPVFGIRDLKTAWQMVSAASRRVTTTATATSLRRSRHWAKHLKKLEAVQPLIVGSTSLGVPTGTAKRRQGKSVAA